MKKIDKQLLHQIFKEIKQGNKEGYNTLYVKYHDLIFGICFSILKNKENSEDVTQNVFAKLINMPKEKLPTSCEATWLYTVTKNEVLLYLRNQNENINIDNAYDISVSDEELENVVDMTAYYEIIKNLNNTEKEIVSLKVLCDFNFREIGQMLNMPIGTVQWHYYKSIKSLKNAISSLASFMLAITFTIAGIHTKKENVDEVQNNNNCKENSGSESKSYEDSIYSEQVSPNSYTSTEQNFSTHTNNNNKVMTGIAGVFLISSIIFAIFFKKSQQKLRKKSSK